MEHRKLSLQLLVLHVLNDGFLVSLPLLLPFIKETLSLSLGQIGMFGGALHVMSVVMALPAAEIAHRLGGMRSLLWGLLTVGLGFLLVGIGQAPMWVGLAFVIAGCGFGIFHPVAFSLLAQQTQRENRGAAMANFTAVGDVGRIILAAIVTYLAVRLGWRWTSLLFGLAAVIISSLIGLKSYSVSKSVNVDDHSLKGIPEILKSRAFLLAMTAFTLDTLASSGLFIFLPFVLLAKQIDPTVLGAMAGFYFVGNIVGKVTIGNAVDRYGYRLVISTAEVFMAILLVMLALAQSWGVIAIISLLLGTVTKGTVPALTTLISDAVPDQKWFQAAFSVNAVVTGIAATLAPVMYGLLADKIGVNQVLYVNAALAAIVLIPLAFLGPGPAASTPKSIESPRLI